MKQAFVFVLSILLTSALIAQNITVNGRLISAADNKPLPYVTIAVAPENTPENSFRKFATKENGSFSTELEKGKYIFIFNFVGIDQVIETIDITAATGTYEIGDIKMSESSTELDELNVTAQRPM